MTKALTLGCVGKPEEVVGMFAFLHAVMQLSSLARSSAQTAAYMGNEFVVLFLFQEVNQIH